ncbi:MAG: hypothetical protein M3384_09865 [Acidobacteriota bacterium]|nr:hypothetical protein [Acidobacteriota bacterium]
MKKTLLYRLFGVGKIPAGARVALESEGVLLSDEGIKGSVTYRNFRSPGRRSNWKRQWYTASIALTKTRLLAFAYSNQIIDVPLADPRFRRLEFSLEAETALLVTFDASLFHADWSGTIEYRFQTPHAQAFLERLREYGV